MISEDQVTEGDIEVDCSEQEKGDSDSRLIEGNFYYPNYTNSTIVALDLLSLP